MTPCLFSISYGGLWGQASLDLPAFIAKAAALGYRNVMLAGKRPHLSPLDFTPERIAQLKTTLDRHNVACRIVAAYTDFAGGPAAEVPAVELQIAYIESLCRMGRGLGANIVRVFTAYRKQFAALPTSGTAWSRCEACDRAAHSDHGGDPEPSRIGVHSDALLELLHDIDRPNASSA